MPFASRLQLAGVLSPGEVRLRHLPLIAALFLAAWLVVHQTGGTKYAHLHVVYIPIIAAAFACRFPGGFGAGLIAAVLMGPLMPLDVAQGTPQTPSNWLFRGFYLVTFGSLIGAIHGVAARRREEIFLITNYDPITNLPLFESLRREIRSAIDRDDPDATHAILNSDIGNAERIQSSFGSEAYEDMMRACAGRLRSVLPVGGFLARGSQTRFLAFVRDCDVERARGAAHRVIASFDEPIPVLALPLPIEMDIGIATYPAHGRVPEEIVRASHSALSEKGQRAERVHVFDPDVDADRRSNVALLSELGLAISRGELRFAAQPKLHQGTGEVAGAELLVRWTHADLGVISPARFIPLAEQSRLIGAVTTAALQAVRDYAAETARVPGHETISFSVNVSGEDVCDPDFPRRVQQAFGGDADLLSRIELEITETALIADLDKAVPVLTALREMGIHIAIDDFGTGYSSLRYLKEIPADTLKIDQAFVRGLKNSGKDQALVRRTIELATDLGLVCVAEGVEDEGTAAWLQANHCDLLQGYWYCQPLEPEQWAAWLADQPTRGPAPQEPAPA